MFSPLSPSDSTVYSQYSSRNQIDKIKDHITVPLGLFQMTQYSEINPKVVYLSFTTMLMPTFYFCHHSPLICITDPVPLVTLFTVLLSEML